MGPKSDEVTSPDEWWMLTIELMRDNAELGSAILFDCGSTGIVTIDETPKKVTLGAYFEARISAEDVTQSLEAHLVGFRGGQIISVTPVVTQDWMQKWKDGFEAIEVGDRLIIAPSWKLPARSDKRIVIQIDPGMAFGTGTHETTRLCLEAIEQFWKGGRLLDVGTGTGILAIAAAKLVPASEIIAIDVDPQAVAVAEENVGINRVSGTVICRQGQPGDLIEQKFDIVVANLTAEVIIDLARDLRACIAQGGLLILSGILCSLVEDVERALYSLKLFLVEKRELGEWSALVFKHEHKLGPEK